VSSRLVVGEGRGSELLRSSMFGSSVLCRKWLSVGVSGMVVTVLASSIDWWYFQRDRIKIQL